jgi:hypothetical protein
VAALALAASALARVQHHQVTVVKSGGVRLLAWDSAKASRGLCFRLRNGTKKGAACHRKMGLAYKSFQLNGATVLGGLARRGETTVTATFSDGQTLVLNTVRGKRYRGRDRGRARFWAGSKPDVTKLVTLVAKNKSGAAVETVSVSSPPAPVPPNPPPPCPPCKGPPRANAHGAIVCPLVICPD